MTIESVMELAKVCTSRSDFVQKHSTEYSWLSRTGLISRLDVLFPKQKGGRPKVERNLEKALAAARLCQNRDEFHSRFKHDFTWMSERNLLHELDAIYGADKRTEQKVVTLDSVRAEIKKSPSRAHFQTYRKVDYAWLKENNLLSELDAVHPLQRSTVFTSEDVFSVLKQCKSRKDFVWNHRREYYWLKDHDLLAELDRAFPLHPWHSDAIQARRETAWTVEELLEDATRFKSRVEWKAAKSGYGAALKRGRDFMRQCCAHMPRISGGSRGLLYSDDDVLASARKYDTRSAWKKEERAYYHAALRRSIWDECVAHMRPAANPFAKDYVVYVYEFSDHSCYVGLSVVPENRRAAHLSRGPVFEHAKVCHNPVYKVLESGLLHQEVGVAETKWQTDYAATGWTPLHVAKAGSLGGIHGSKWTKEAIMAEALKYQTRQEWIDKSSMSYRIAKREGWFELASAHMPRRVLGIGLGRTVSLETRQKQREAKLGHKQSVAQREARSAALKARWAQTLS